MKATILGPIRYALRLYNADDDLLNGTASTRDLEGSRKLAQSILLLFPSAAYVSIFEMKDGQERSLPAATVSFDDEWESEES